LFNIGDSRYPERVLSRFGRRELAIGIILCGTGTHGDLGLSEIRRLVMVQDPDTGVHYQMP